jgi:hypothetical protein
MGASSSDDEEQDLQVQVMIKAGGRKQLFAFTDFFIEQAAPEITGLATALVPDI